MSSYEYVYWAGDTRMRLMFKNYVDENEALKIRVYKQCKNIQENGLEYQTILNGKVVPNTTISNSKHFDFQPLIDAYTAYNTEYVRLLNLSELSSSSELSSKTLANAFIAVTIFFISCC